MKIHVDRHERIKIKPASRFRMSVTVLVLLCTITQQLLLGYGAIVLADSNASAPAPHADDGNEEIEKPKQDHDAWKSLVPEKPASVESLIRNVNRWSSHQGKSKGRSASVHIGDDLNDHVNSQRLGQTGSGSQTRPNEGKPGPDDAADPVELTTGEFVQNEVDMRISSRGLSIEISRTYRSKQQHPGMMGYNWFLNYESRIMKMENGNYAVLEMGGRREEYKKSGSVYSPPERHYDTLIPQINGSILITKKDGSSALYDVNGNLSVLSDRFGNKLSFTYSPAKMALTGKSDFIVGGQSGLIAMMYRLATVTDCYGRRVQFDYFDATNPLKTGRIKSITDYVGRQVQYDYSDNGDLISVRAPATADFPSGKLTTYDYTTGLVDARLNHNLTRIRDGNNQVFLENFYDETNTDPLQRDRVIKQINGSGFYTFSYTLYVETDAPVAWTPEDKKSIVGLSKTVQIKDRNNNIISYALNLGGMFTSVQRRNLAGSYYATSYFYDSINQLTDIRFPLNNSIKYTYDLNGNVSSERRKKSYFAPDDNVNDIVTYFEYENLYNKVKRSIDGNGNVWINYFDYEETHKLSVPIAGSSTWTFNVANSGYGDLNGAADFDRGLVVCTKFLGFNDGATDTNAANDGVVAGQPAGQAQPISIKYTYNKFGQMLSTIDPEGIVSAYEYYPENDPDGDGVLTGQDLLPPLGTGQYGYIKKATADFGTGKLNYVTEYHYDKVGNITSIKNPRGDTMTFTVNELNQVTKVISPPVTLFNSIIVNYETRYEYDSNNNLSRVRIHNIDESGALGTPEWIEATYSYDILDNLLTATEGVGTPDERTTTYFYDNNENVTKITMPEGNATQYVFDERDMVWKIIQDPDGLPTPIAATTLLDYDLNGNCIKVTNPISHITTYTFDLFDRQSTVKDALNGVLNFQYDKNSNVISTEFNGPTAIRFSRNEYVYDELNRGIKERRITNPTNSSTYLETASLFDKNSRVIKVTDPNAKTLSMAYDNINRLFKMTDHLGNIKQSIFDQSSNIVESVNTEIIPSQASKVYRSKATFDSLDRLITQRDCGPDGIIDNADDRIRTFRYDSRGNNTRLIDPMGVVTQAMYDNLSRRVQLATDVGAGSSVNAITKFNYDKNSRLHSYAGIRNNADPVTQYHETTFEYDRLDRVVKTLFPDGRFTAVEFDRASNVVKSTDALNSSAIFTYDELERLTRIAVTRAAGVTGTSDRNYVYDAFSRITEVRENNELGTTNDDSKVVYTYDLLSRITSERQVYGTAFDKTISLGFDDGATDKTNLCKLTYADGSIVRYARDAVDRVNGVFYGDNTSRKLASYSYAGFGRTLSRSLFNGAATPSAMGISTISFDGVKRATLLESKLLNGSHVASFEYGYDKADNRVYSKALHYAGSGEIYKYDSAYRLSEYYANASAGDISNAATAVAAGNLPAAPATYGSRTTYVIDDLGNRQAVKVTGANGAAEATTNYTSSTATTDYKMNRYTTVGASTLAYDANGNLTDDGTLLYEYDAFNRVITVKRKSDSALIANYTYDGLGRRVRKTVSNSGSLNGSTHFVYNLSALIEEYTISNPGASETNSRVARYIFGRSGDDRICVEKADVADVNNNGNTTELLLFYYYIDILGSVRAITWFDGTSERVVERVDYDVYGKATITTWGADRNIDTAGDNVARTTSLIGNPFLFTAQYFDAESGNYQYRSRYYSPSIGRFLTQDPSHYVDGANMYQYCLSRPTRFIDPTGRGVVGGVVSWFTVGEYNENANAGELLSAASTGAQEGLKGGASILANEFSFGYSDEWGLTESTSYHGPEYDASRVSAYIAKEAIMYATGSKLAGGAISLASKADKLRKLMECGSKFKDLLRLKNAIDNMESISGLADNVVEIIDAMKAGNYKKASKKIFDAGLTVADLLDGFHGVDLNKSCFVAGTPVATSNGLVAIEDIQVGDRVLTPESGTDKVLPTAVNSETWQVVELELPDPDSNGLDVFQIKLLRPKLWLDKNGYIQDAFVEARFDELNVAGIARVKSITKCPELSSAPGRLVLMTVNHLNNQVIELNFANGDRIGVTSAHKIHSKTQNSWISASELVPGEECSTIGRTSTLLNLAVPREGTWRVFNFEVESEHVYYVGKEQILVHNTGCTGKGRDHVAYEGLKDGKPYSGYASAPAGKFKTPEDIINYRYNGNFDQFGGKPPSAIAGTHGTGVAGKEKARGTEQAKYQENVDKYGKANVANKQNPVGPNNPRRDKYMDAAGVKYQKK